jgi:phosphoglycolate phosphatase
MKKKIELIMFDLDGTLADTGHDLVNTVNYVRSHFDLQPLENRMVYEHVGRGVDHLIRSFLPQKFQEKFGEARDLFLDHYAEHLLDTTVLYPHVKETLEYFRKKKRAVVSNKLHHLTVAVLAGLGIEACFDAVLGGDSLPERKPDPGPLKQVLETFGVKPVVALIVGDGAADMEAGKAAGVFTCGVTYGLGDTEELVQAKPDFLIDNLGQLTDHFC